MKEAKNLLINQSITREAVEQENPLKSWNTGTFVCIFILKICLKKSSLHRRRLQLCRFDIILVENVLSWAVSISLQRL